MINYNNIEVKVNGSGLIVENANLTTNNALQSIGVIGYKNPIAFPVTNALKSQASINYLIEVDNEPNIPIVEFIKTGINNQTWTATPIVIGQITGSGYLDSYSLRVIPNEPVMANVSFLIFSPLTGQYQATQSARAISFSGIAHGLSSLFLDDNSLPSLVNFYNFDYDFKATWNPVYTIGNLYPIQVQLVNAEENFSIISDDYRHINYSGEALTGHYNTRQLQIYSFATNIPLTLNLSGAIVTSNQLNVSLDDIGRILTTATNTY